MEKSKMSISFSNMFLAHLHDEYLRRIYLQRQNTIEGGSNT